ncbi:MAG: T9SS type A sorting domain-containing protein [Saprospiraceae bacterium]|nr:T9SS type A sorting domain-containing protein [Saprospiraceae bacterium]
MKKILSFLFISSLCIFQITAQNAFWKPITSNLAPRNGSDWNKISNLSYFQLDREAYARHLINLSNSAGQSEFELELPMPGGVWKTFKVKESPVMEAELAAKFPEIKTYAGHHGELYMRLSISPYSFQVYILTPEGDVVIDAPDRKRDVYAMFRGSDIQFDEAFNLSCGTKDLDALDKSEEHTHEKTLQPRSPQGAPVNLRTYRLALACTAEWALDGGRGGGSVQTALDKMVASLSYINAVYEKDVAVHMNLVANNDKLIFLDPVSDPYGNPTSGGSTLGQNTDVITGIIGRAAYDIGHVFTNTCTDVGGVAFLASVCNANKGGGVTCWYNTDIAYVTQRIACHEMGHQFSASHTFSNCNGNESATSYEPGSGTSIMSYSGLCGAGLNVETGNLPHPNYFHTNSVERIYNYTRTGDGSRCGVQTTTNNSFPDAEISFPSGLYIPIRTPIWLKGSATDMENDNLTYNWEQYDAAGYGPVLGEPLLDEEGPLFKSVFPGTSPNRIIPIWNTILTKKNFERTEVLPTVNRKITFRFNVRDNHAGAGATTTKQTFFYAIDSAGPFQLTFPNVDTKDTLYSGGCNLIRWDVANTNKSPVNCKKVNIYLMPNRTNPNVMVPLLMGTENDGDAIVDIPDTYVGMIRSRIVIEAADNIFLDASDSDIRILSNANRNGVLFGVAPSDFVFCIPNSIDLDIQACTFGSASGNLRLLLGNGLPDGAVYQFENDQLPGSGSTKLKLDFTNVEASGIYRVEVLAITDAGDTLREWIDMDLVNVNFTDLKTIYPASGLAGLPQSVEFKWTAARNALSYRLEIATSPSFGSSLVYSLDGIKDTVITPIVFLNESTLYYWRIIPVNRCGLGSPSVPSPFQTVNKKCELTDYPGNVLVRSANKTGYMPVPIRGSGIISDVNVNDVYANAIGVNSITLTLVSPQGTRVKLFDRNCGVTDLFDCSFDDEGLLNIMNGCPPAQKKIIKPLESLSKFNGEDQAGDWTLEVVTDRFLSGQANFYGFKLDICSEIKVNNPFLITNLGLQMNQGELRNIGQDKLESADVDNTAAELIYTIVVIPQRGDLMLNGVKLDYGSKFSQKDINDGRLSYKHTGGPMETDGFLFLVEDGVGGWFGTDFFKIQIGPVDTRQEDEFEFNVFPNPAKNKVQLTFSETLEKDAQLSVFDLNGRVCMKQGLPSRRAELIDIANLENGIYVFQIRSGKQFKTVKLVVQR